MEEFIKNFASQLLDPATANLGADTIFRNLDDWDSLTAMAVIAMIDDEYQVKIDDTDFRKFNTIEDIYQYVIQAKSV